MKRDNIAGLATLAESETSQNMILNAMTHSESPIQSIPTPAFPSALIPDILYKVFLFAVHGSTHAGTTALLISHVCRYWRDFALGCASLWGFVDLSYPYASRLAFSLFLGRSGEAPLKLAWTTVDDFSLFKHPISSPRPDPLASSKLRFESCAADILPRLHSLTLHLTYSEFAQVGHLFQTELSFRPRCLDIQLHSVPSSDVLPWTDLLPIDLSLLRELELDSAVLPRGILEPVQNRLTRFSLWHPVNLPTIPEILLFLSHCPLLNELKLGFSTTDDTDDIASLLTAEATRDSDTTMTHSETVQLKFPNLKKLELVSSNGRSSYECIRQISACIQDLRSLSTFFLEYALPTCYRRTFSWYIPEQLNQWKSTRPCSIFDLVPPKSFSHFTKHRYLFIKFFRYNGEFIIHSSPDSKPSRDGLGNISPLYISGAGQPNGLFDYSPIVELIHAMPAITHLELAYGGWEVLTSWNIDVRATFPHLTTLALFSFHESASDCTDVLNSLPEGFKLETLILGINHIASPEMFADAVDRLGIRLVEWRDNYNRRDEIKHQVIGTLRERGVMVAVRT